MHDGRVCCYTNRCIQVSLPNLKIYVLIFTCAIGSKMTLVLKIRGIFIFLNNSFSCSHDSVFVSKNESNDDIAEKEFFYAVKFLFFKLVLSMRLRFAVCQMFTKLFNQEKGAWC